MNNQEMSSSVVDILKITIKDTVKQSVKQTIKDAIRDTVKDTVKQTMKDTLKEILSKLSWKHLLMVTIPLGLLIYPKPIIKLVRSLFQTGKTNVVHHHNHNLKQIILTSCEFITTENIENLHVVKGSQPKLYLYKATQIITIEKFKKTNFLIKQKLNKQSDLYPEILQLQSQGLWNNFRLSKLQNPYLKIVLIKAQEDILKHFFVRFYKIGEKYVNKIGSFGQNKLNILRYDEKSDSYQHLSCQFDLLSNQS